VSLNVYPDCLLISYSNEKKPKFSLNSSEGVALICTVFLPGSNFIFELGEIGIASEYI